jgi:hypothetical protein
LTHPVSDEGIPHEVKDRPLLLATGFSHRQDPFNKTAARIRLGAMRGASPDNRMTQRAFGTVVGRFEARHRSASAASRRRHVAVVREEETVNPMVSQCWIWVHPREMQDNSGPTYGTVFDNRSVIHMIDGSLYI